MKKYNLPLFLLVIVTGIQIAISTLAQTITPANDGTNTNINVNNNQININGGTLSSDGANLFHSFTQFGLTSGQIANFLSNPNINNILGRITGGNPSFINGLIQVTGGNSNLFLMNPAGLIFGNNASLNVPADFTATTATGIGFNNGYFSAFDNNNYADLIGNPNAFIFDNVTGTIINSGNLILSPEHDLNLIGNTVINTGTIKAEGGNINLVAVEGTNRVKLSQEGHILSLEFETPVDREITVLDLPKLLTGSNNITDLTVNNNQVETNNGTIIPNISGITVNSGILDVSSPILGGNINLFGNIVALIDNAQLNLNGNMGGGIALIGGDYQGNGTVPNAQNTFVTSNVVINADALSEGNGGKVIIWADGNTRFYGNITAQGGNISGDGGFVEVSGKQNLDFQGNVNTSAVNGDFGTLLLDPTDIIISDIPAGTGNGDYLNGNILSTSTPTSMTISEASLEALAYNTNILIQATNDITIGTLSDNILAFAHLNGPNIYGDNVGGIGNIIFNAGGNFLMNTTHTINALGRTLTISAGNNVTLGNIYTGVHTNNQINAGSVNITATLGNINVNSIDSSATTYYGHVGNGGDVILNALNGNINITNGIYSSTRTNGSFDTAKSAGSITLNAPNGSITVPMLDSSVNINILSGNSGKNGGIISITGAFNLNQATSILSYGGNLGVGGNININGTVNGNYDLSLNAGTGNINFNDTVGDVTALSNLIVVNTTGTTNLNGNITTTGLQTYNNLVNVNSSSILTGSTLTLGDIVNINNNANLTLNFPTINLNDPINNTGTGTLSGNATTVNINNISAIIQNGVDVALSGATLNIVSGTFSDPTVININKNLTLTGQGQTSTFLNGSNSHQVLNIASGNTVNINNLGIQNGNSIDNGGGIYNAGILNINNSTISNNTASNNGGGIFNAGSIFTNATLTINNSIISGNVANGLDNTGNYEGGGGIYNYLGTFTITNSNISNNTTAPLGGGLFSFRGGASTISNTTISNNTSAVGGGIWLEQSTLNISNSNISSNTSSVGGSAIMNRGYLTLTNNIISNNISTYSGGFLAYESALTNVFTLTLNSGNIFSNNGVSIFSTTGDIIGKTLNNTSFSEPIAYIILNNNPLLGEIDATNATFEGVTGANATLAQLFAIEDKIIHDIDLQSTRGFIRVKADNVYVTPPSTWDGSIQRGINLANIGDTVNIATGNYTESAVNINKSLNLLFDNTGVNISGDLTTSASGTIGLLGNVTATNINLNDPIILNGSTTLGGTTFNLANTLNGNSKDLTLNFTDQINLNNSTLTNVNNLNVTATNGILLGGNFTTTANQTYNTTVTLTNDTSLNGNIINFNNSLNSDSNPRNLTINSNQVFFNNLTGNLNPLNQLDITTNNLTINNNLITNSNITLNTPLINLNNANISSLGGNFNLQNTNNLNITGTGNILTQGGNITVNAPDISASNINFDSSNIAGQGGSIDLTATNNQILIGNINSSGISGGNITLQALNAMTMGIIDSHGITGNGGNIILDPLGDIQVSYINAQGGNTGIGGNIDITAGQYFRATDTFTALNGLNMSISSVGGLGGGSVIIRHGGNGITPFIIGDASLNGTMGAITSGDYTFTKYNSFLPSQILGNLQILTDFIETQDITINEENIFILPELNAVENESGDTSVPLINMSINTNNMAVEGYTETVDQTFTQSFSSYFGANIQAEPVNLAEVQDKLSKVEEITGITPAIVHASFIPSSDNTQQNDQLQLIFTPPDGQSIIHKINVTREEIYNTSQKFIGGVTNPRRPHGYEQYSQELYQWLIEPLKEDLEHYSVEHISFAVDQGLRSLPWAALSDGKQFLIEQYSISQMPSLSLVNLDYTDIRDSQVLAMGAETFTNQSPLPAVPMELDLVSNHVWQGESYLNQDFSIAQLKSARSQNSYGIIHLATHGEFAQGNPQDSYIQFGTEKLTLDQLQTLGLSDPPVELMVLSACRSALGDKDAEMGFAGLAVLAGVKSALGSLWYISDAGTLGLISEFYEQLRSSSIKSEALRQTQIAMLKGEVKLENGDLITTNGSFILTEELKNLGNVDLNHPYYWSAFTIIGNPW